LGQALVASLWAAGFNADCEAASGPRSAASARKAKQQSGIAFRLEIISGKQ